MTDPWNLHLVVVVDKASHLGSAICFRPKNGKSGKVRPQSARA